jgi:uncharacterized protein YeaO (DUF488 family)
MIKLKKTGQIRSKEECVRILENKLSPLDDKGNQIKLNLWLDGLECEIEDMYFHDNEKWFKFKSRYRDEFEDKIELMDNILANKKEKVKVTWISIFKGK